METGELSMLQIWKWRVFFVVFFFFTFSPRYHLLWAFWWVQTETSIKDEQSFKMAALELYWCSCFFAPRPQRRVLTENKLSAFSCCSLVAERGSWWTANRFPSPPSRTSPGLGSPPKVRTRTEFLTPGWRVWFQRRFLMFSGTPCYVDSNGLVRMLNRALGNTWTPVCNTRETCKSKSDHYWVVGAHENPQQLRWASKPHRKLEEAFTYYCWEKRWLYMENKVFLCWK